MKRQLSHQGGVLRFTAHGRTVLAIEGHVKDAGAPFLGHFGLQLQAFSHPHLDAAVMVTDRKQPLLGLGAQQNGAGVVHEIQCWFWFCIRNKTD